jgi:hypothetical protein
LDCGYNVVGGKGRQIGFTSALGLFAIKQLIIKVNYYIKFITEDFDTGVEIFNDKIKYPFGAVPRWLQPSVKGDSGNRFWLSDKTSKGQKGYPNSRLDVVAPKLTAVNGGSPQLVLIDEIGQIPVLGPMLNEARPTMFWTDPTTGKFTLKRQIWMWGTGGNLEQGGIAFKTEWARILSLWESGSYKGAFIPIFFSWTLRLTKQEYEDEKDWYYGGRSLEENIDLETSKVQFHQHYPSSWRDMFLTTANTIVSRDVIEEGINRCLLMDQEVKPIHGYFEPIYDETTPAGMGSDVPFKIKGARFIACDDHNMHKASVVIFQKPEYGWKHRYWQGTDPIATETGRSKMASSIWDEYLKTVPAVVNFRKRHDHKYTFLQCLLLGLYYDTGSEYKAGVKELVEANIGTNYIDYKDAKGFLNSLIFNSI